MRFSRFPLVYECLTAKYPSIKTAIAVTLTWLISVIICFIMCGLLEILNGWTFISR